MKPRTMLDVMKSTLRERIVALETALDADSIGIVAPLFSGVEQRVAAATKFATPRKRLAVVLDTLGGNIEVVERIVQVIRSAYDDVWFIVPNKAMSAGTAFVMSGNQILMNTFSVLGPIDTQVTKTIKGEAQRIPVHAYLAQADVLLQKAASGAMTEAELAILTGSFDLGELHQFREQSKLTRELVTDWLAKYKFSAWTKTETAGKPVDDQMRKDRAANVAKTLDDYSRWHSHGRGISMKTLTTDQPAGLGLKIRDFGQEAQLAETIADYYDCFMDLATREGGLNIVHSRDYL